MTFVVKNGIVCNVIEIFGMSREEYEKLEGCRLVDVNGHAGIKIGDTYEAKTGFFYRDGLRVDAINALEIRDARLKASDYAMMPDYPCSETERSGWITYRQALRDLPEQEGYPDSIVWPEPPSRDKHGATLVSAMQLHDAQIQAVSDRVEFDEDCLAELAIETM